MKTKIFLAVVLVGTVIAVAFGQSRVDFEKKLGKNLRGSEICCNFAVLKDDMAI